MASSPTYLGPHATRALGTGSQEQEPDRAPLQTCLELISSPQPAALHEFAPSSSKGEVTEAGRLPSGDSHTESNMSPQAAPAPSPNLASHSRPPPALSRAPSPRSQVRPQRHGPNPSRRRRVQPIARAIIPPASVRAPLPGSQHRRAARDAQVPEAPLCLPLGRRAQCRTHRKCRHRAGRERGSVSRGGARRAGTPRG